jgi:diaminopimelate decarboxylase
VITAAVEQRARELAEAGQLPAYIYDLEALRDHIAAIRTALPKETAEIFYAAKANPDPAILRTLARYVDGIEVASGGELAHVVEVLPDARIAFGGPGKTDTELAAGAQHAERIHVESPWELTRLADIIRDTGRSVDVLLRANLAAANEGVALAMSGPFGMDPDLITDCVPILTANPHVRLRGIHAHLASGLAAPAMLTRAKEILSWAREWLNTHAQVENPEFNIGGGMGVNYGDPTDLFDWTTYGKQLAELARPGETLRIEPGRAITVYCGHYVTRVLDIKKAHGEWFAVLAGGTHQIRTPVTKNHNQPFTVLPGTAGAGGPSTSNNPVTLVGQLCTPKDVFARRIPLSDVAVGDIIAFAMAGAYAWNISHHDFLMHPKPAFACLEG